MWPCLHGLMSAPCAKSRTLWRWTAPRSELATSPIARRRRRSLAPSRQPQTALRRPFLPERESMPLRCGGLHPAVEAIEVGGMDRSILIADRADENRIPGTASGRRRRAAWATLRETDQAAPRRAATARWLRGGCTPAPSERARRRSGEGASPSPPMMDAWNIRRPRVLPRPPAEGRAGRRRRAAREQRPRRSPACRRRAPSIISSSS